MKSPSSRAIKKAFAPVETQQARLRYFTDEKPGIQRQRRGKSFVYVQPDGKRLKDEETLKRIKHLVIPPAWEDVWICPVENGHIQATGRDARGRKQYRYHQRWREQRDENKFSRILGFARVLPRIRRRVRRDLKRRGMPREKVLATIVRLLEGTLIRVGNEEYARDNHSYGLTTMKNSHVAVRGAKMRFAFRGKSGKRHEISLYDRQLARIVKRCQEMPDQDLFVYEDESGEVRHVGSQDVNEYLRAIAGEEYTAKDFRTWAGTVLAAVALREFKAVTHQQQIKKNVLRATEAVAQLLGNTPTVCRKCYVHPEIFESYLAGDTISTIEQRAEGKIDRGLSRLRAEEAAVLVLLQRRLRKSGRKARK
ncbi:MAG TPA: DNA topoisomerase IB [Chthoniobacter sp.]|nr:DNA topoisomerase IB [Chthoniobacter sp.]